jgi:hypothetical protein
MGSPARVESSTVFFVVGRCGQGVGGWSGLEDFVFFSPGACWMQAVVGNSCSYFTMIYLLPIYSLADSFCPSVYLSVHPSNSITEGGGKYKSPQRRRIDHIHSCVPLSPRFYRTRAVGRERGLGALRGGERPWEGEHQNAARPSPWRR